MSNLSKNAISTKEISGIFANTDTSLAVEMANAFCSFDCVDQAAFFEAVQRASSQWDKPSSFQWYEMGKSMNKDTKFMISQMNDAVHEVEA